MNLKKGLYPVWIRCLFSSLKNWLSSEAFKNSGRTACLFSCKRPAVHVFNSQSVLESGWFFPPFDGKLMAQPSWALSVPGNKKTSNSPWVLYLLSVCFSCWALIVDLLCRISLSFQPIRWNRKDKHIKWFECSWLLVSDTGESLGATDYSALWFGSEQ